MNWRVLVLNGGMEPVGLILWTEAINLLLKNRASAFEWYPEVFIRTARESYQLPSVIVLRWIQTSKKPVRFSRKNVFHRDNHTCQYCGRKFPEAKLTLDHVIPKCHRTRESWRSWKNIATACYSCNQKKAGRTPEEAGMRLLREPFKPEWLPEMTLIRADPSDPQYSIWKQYLNLAK